MFLIFRREGTVIEDWVRRKRGGQYRQSSFGKVHCWMGNKIFTEKMFLYGELNVVLSKEMVSQSIWSFYCM